MWNNFKNKFKNLFDDQEETYSDNTKSVSREQEAKESHANTRMTYKYPKQGNFRFPVIPDRITQEEQSDSQEHETRRVKRAQPMDDDDQFKPSYRRKRNRSWDKEEVNHKKKEKPAVSPEPFTPSDVPSPVYGYHPRAKPATNFEELAEMNDKSTHTSIMEQARYDEEHWQRVRQRVLGKIESSKQVDKESQREENEEASSNSQMESEKETSFEKHPFANETAEELYEESEDVTSFSQKKVELEEGRGERELSAMEATTEEHVEDVDAHPTAEEERTTESNTADVVPLPEPAEVSTSDRESKTAVEPVKRKENKPTRPSGGRNSERKSVPFNVVMTPRDKRTRDQKKTLNKGSETEKSKIHQQAEGKRQTYATPLHLLNDKAKRSSDDDQWVQEQMERLETTLREFHVKAKVVHAMKGPSVTRFEVQPEPGVKVSKITNLSDDIKLSMAARDIRIEAPIPGKQAVGIEVPNRHPEMVGLQEIFESDKFTKESSPLSVGLGLDIGGDSVVTNLKKMPHGLIAGATGSGKSVCINTILISMLYKAHHDDVKFLLIDPKMVELAPYNGLPHLVSPVITDVKAATSALKWAVKEMEERYEKFVAEGARDVERFNEKMIQQGRSSEKLPYLVIVIDELADLMMVSPQDVEDAICRIAQKARACGIHLLLATQRPSVDVITGLIKANIPTRIAFSVSSQVDSRTIIDTGGAEKLLGKGDMLFIENGSGQSVRIQGAFVSDEEIERITGYVKKIAPPNYLFEQEELLHQVSSEEDTDELFDEAVHFVLEHNGASASLLQRRFKVGYNRAARLIDQMADYGIISESKGSKPRDILLTKQQVDEMMVR
ncbi:DNA translocase FtsK [Halobacillus sp. A1]|uniref:DNA translocase FtsK n=1 Tax=Halobacillus sp. A1 TaxID=2880262 RepID=UPI0020A65F58|nr:DNA translocase FtsK [Halobacillus sp. A1]MCP3033113.1 DNA translocase FtsK [Halobacillus sp. A1]